MLQVGEPWRNLIIRLDAVHLHELRASQNFPLHALLEHSGPPQLSLELLFVLPLLQFR